MDAPSAQPGSPSPPQDLDLYCLECGYNLRGLSGDPRRCPECFHLNPVGDAELSAEVISRQLRRMETAPALCVGSFVVGAAMAVPTIATILEARNANTSFCCGGTLLVPAIVWLGGISEFATSCMGKPGWFRVLMRYHFYGVTMAAIVVAAVAGIALPLFYNVRSDWQFLLIVTILIFAIVLSVPPVSRWAHRRAREGLEPLQREVAVKLARDRIRRQLRRPH
jgi:hypothetical protein